MEFGETLCLWNQSFLREVGLGGLNIMAQYAAYIGTLNSSTKKDIA